MSGSVRLVSGTRCGCISKCLLLHPWYMGLKKEASNGRDAQRDGRILAVNLMHLAAAIGAIGAGLQI